MFRKVSINSQKYRKTKCKDLKNIGTLNDRIYDRHLGVPGFDQNIYSNSRVDIIGAGMNTELGEGLVRKGIGSIRYVDFDTVSLPNLNRQHFQQGDIGKPKAFQIIKNLQKVGFMGTELYGYNEYVQNYIKKYNPKPDLFICGVDNDEARICTAKYGLANNIPVIFTAVSRDANQCYVFIQKVGEACFGCTFPEAIHNTVSPCPNIPSMKDVIKVASGFVLFAIDSVLTNRPISWNYRLIFLAGFLDDHKTVKERNPNCELCGKLEATNVE